MLQLQEAVATAKKYVSDAFADEQIADIGLEEIEFVPERDLWEVTVGFVRGADAVELKTKSRSALHKSPLYNYYQKGQRRSFKIVRIDAGSGRVLTMKSHPVESQPT